MYHHIDQYVEDSGAKRLLPRETNKSKQDTDLLQSTFLNAITKLWITNTSTRIRTDPHNTT